MIHIINRKNFIISITKAFYKNFIIYLTNRIISSIAKDASQGFLFKLLPKTNLKAVALCDKTLSIFLWKHIYI